MLLGNTRNYYEIKEIDRERERECAQKTKHNLCVTHIIYIVREVESFRRLSILIDVAHDLEFYRPRHLSKWNEIITISGEAGLSTAIE